MQLQVFPKFGRLLVLRGIFPARAVYFAYSEMSSFPLRHILTGVIY